MKAQVVINYLTKQGVKKVEMDAVGLPEWLATKKPTDKVTAQELEDFIKANAVELEDVVLGGKKRVFRKLTQQQIDEAFKEPAGFPDTSFVACLCSFSCLSGEV